MMNRYLPSFSVHHALSILAASIFFGLGFAACGSGLDAGSDGSDVQVTAETTDDAFVAPPDTEALADVDAIGDVSDVMGVDLVTERDAAPDVDDVAVVSDVSVRDVLSDGASGDDGQTLDDGETPDDGETLDDAVETLDDAVDDVLSPDVFDDDAVDDVIGDIAGPGSFDDLADLSGSDLRAALLERISGHTVLGYEGEGVARQVLFAVVDAHDGRLECVYTGRTVAAEDPLAAPLGTGPGPAIDTTPNQDCRWPDGSPVSGGCAFNTEHSWPRSLGANNPPASSDLHHLFPSLDGANNQRGSYVFGETVCTGSACPWSEGESEFGVRSDGTRVFQVRQRFQGDIARAQFYFAVRYARAIDATVEATLRAWHLADPPDADEMARNDAIERYQHNRNPFVDRPDFVSRLLDF